MDNTNDPVDGTGGTPVDAEPESNVPEATTPPIETAETKQTEPIDKTFIKTVVDQVLEAQHLTIDNNRHRSIVDEAYGDIYKDCR